MLPCKIITQKHSLIVVVASERIGKFICSIIKQNRLPYIREISYRGDFDSLECGGLNLRILVSAMIESEDMEELKTIVSYAANDCILKSTKHRKKLTTFLPKNTWAH